MASILRIFFVYVLCCALLPNAYARHYDHSFKHSWHHSSKKERKEREKEHKKIREYFSHHFHKRFKSKRGHNKKCRDTNFKSLAEMRHSRCVEVVEDENSIRITSDYDLTFHPKFKLTTTKTLIIEARDLYLKNHAKLFAKRMIVNIEDQLKSDKHSKLCAEIIVLEAARARLKGQACQSAQVIGSVVGKPSAIAVLKVLPLPENPTVPQTVNFDWSASFGIREVEATLDLGNGVVLNSTEKNASYVYQEASSYATQVKLNTQEDLRLVMSKPLH